MRIIRRLIARYRAWRRRGQIWAHGRRYSCFEAMDDIDDARRW